MDLKKTKLPYDTCKFMLGQLCGHIHNIHIHESAYDPIPTCMCPPPEHSGSDYVLFQAGSTMREAIIREWEILTVDERGALRRYILHYITNKP